MYFFQKSYLERYTMNTFAVWIVMTSVKYVARLPLNGSFSVATKRLTCNLIYQSNKSYSFNTELF